MSAVTESGPRTSGRKPAVLILWILAVLFLLLAIVYLAAPAKDLPGFIGHIKNGGAGARPADGYLVRDRHRVRRGRLVRQPGRQVGQQVAGPHRPVPERRPPAQPGALWDLRLPLGSGHVFHRPAAAMAARRVRRFRHWPGHHRDHVHPALHPGRQHRRAALPVPDDPDIRRWPRSAFCFSASSQASRCTRWRKPGSPRR